MSPPLLPSLCFFSSQAPTALAPVHLNSPTETSGCQQQWPLLCHCPPLHHAALCHPLHCPLQVADEQSAGLHHVRPLHCVPGGQRPPGRQNSRLPSIHLAGSAISLTSSTDDPFNSGVLSSLLSEEEAAD